MRLAEEPVPQSYHLWDNDWTPLSQNPRWNRRYSPIPMLLHSDSLSVNILQCWHCLLKGHVQRIIISNVGIVKSFVDDLIGTRYCTYESGLCTTIYWGSAVVPAICVRQRMHWWTVLKHSSNCIVSLTASPPPICQLNQPLTQPWEKWHLDHSFPFPHCIIIISWER